MLRDRVITALILGLLLLALLLLAPASIVIAVITAAILLGALEWAQFCGWAKSPWRFAYVAAVALLLAFVDQIMSRVSAVSNVLLLAVLWWGVALAWVSLAPQRVNRWLAAAAGFFVLVPTWLALVLLQGAPTRGRAVLLFLLILVVAADIGAYFSGRAFGRIKLAPRVSPGKSWEGVLGGMVGALLVAWVGAQWLALPVGPFVSLCAAVAVASVVGDLTESMFKRHVGLKDSGTLLPGHGGILDRLDSITAAAPVFALGMMWSGLL